LSQAGGVHGAAVVTSRSTDGGLHWSSPVTTATGANLDKNWIACDTTSSSPFFGNCYTEFDDTTNGNRLKMSRSTNGGVSWGAALNTGDAASGLGGQPVVRPNGTVLVPFLSSSGQIRSFRSVDGGASWRATVLVATGQRPHGSRWVAHRAPALGRDRRGRDRLCGVAGLPVPVRLCRQ
jgi:hypothetical protein